MSNVQTKAIMPFGAQDPNVLVMFCLRKKKQSIVRANSNRVLTHTLNAFATLTWGTATSGAARNG
jgi:hypothetical protein